MFYELREYRIRDGSRDNFSKIMDEIAIPFQKSKGMDVVASFVSLEEDDLYVWIRRFESEEQRKRLYDAVYGDPHWKEVIRPLMQDMLIRELVRVKLLQSTPRSAL